jgi:EamA-like transporter family
MALGIVVTTAGVYIVSVESVKSQEDRRGEPAEDVSTDLNRAETGDYRYTAVTTGNDEEQRRHVCIDTISDETKECEDVVQSNHKFNSHIIEGYVFAFINVALDAYGSVLTKQYGVSFNTWEINSIRFGFAAIVMGLFSLTIVVLNKLVSTVSIVTPPVKAGNNCTRNNAVQTRRESLTTYFLRHSDQRELQSGEVRFVNGPGAGDSTNGSDSVCIEDEAVNVRQRSLSQEMVEIHLWDTAGVNGHDTGKSMDGHTVSRARGDTGTGVIGDAGNSSGQPTNTRGSAPMSDAVSSVTSPWYLMPNRTQMSPSLWLRVSVGVLFVTFLCPMLSNYALFQIDLGLCLTLTSLGPIYAIPLLWLIKGDVISLRAMLGSLLAVAGVAIMCLL